ncbi:MAG: hypothetical protein V1869_05210 [Candidatus Omnitrophota bacterium]
MKLKIAGVLTVLILVSAGLTLGEDQITGLQTADTASQQENSDVNTQWVWGEVTGIDAQGKTLTLKHLDYETDQEKEVVLAVDNLTTYDNVKSLEEIRPGDNLSVDYISQDGKNMAKSISLEQSEGAPAVNNPDVAGQPS